MTFYDKASSQFFSKCSKYAKKMRFGLRVLSTCIVALLAPHSWSVVNGIKMASIARTVVDSFAAKIFQPSRGPFDMFSNCHWQTIVGSEAIRTKIFGVYPRSFTTIKQRVATPDNDFFDIDLTSNFFDSQNVVIMLHGLESNTHGALMTKMASAFVAKGFGCCLVSFRSCNGADNDTPGAYHLGFTDDLHLLVEMFNQKYPDKLLYFSGFSLGGNVVLKFLGEVSDEASHKKIAGAVTTCVPFDPVASQGKIDVGFNRAVYSENFLLTLKKKAERKITRFPGSFDIEAVRACRCIGDFDNAFIAPLCGFRDKVDYYRKTGSKWWLNKIRVPTFAINARDDPFIEESSLPTAEDVGDVAPVRLIYHDYGGHCGFISRDETSPNGWLAEEMANVLDHIRSARIQHEHDITQQQQQQQQPLQSLLQSEHCEIIDEMRVAEAISLSTAL